MKKYVYDRTSNGINIFNVQKQYEKIMVAARIIASIPDPSTVIVRKIYLLQAVSARLYGQRGVYKFAQLTKTVAVTGRWTPGMLTNQNTKSFVEPRLLILTDPRVDYNALIESSYVNIPIIALTNTDNNLSYVDCAIPCNNRAPRSLAMIFWLLTREVLRLKGELEDDTLSVLPDLFMYRDLEKEAKNKAAQEQEALQAGDDNVEERDDENAEDDFLDNES